MMAERKPVVVHVLPPPEHDPNEVRAFARVVHRALRMICAYLEKRYSL